MPENRNQRPSLIRIIAAVLLGFFGGFFLFLLVALVIGGINDLLGVRIPINLLIAENIYSAVTLLVIIILCIAGTLWLVWKTPPSEQEEATVLENPPT